MIRSRRIVWAAGLGLAVVGMASCKKKEAPPPPEAAAPAPAPAPPAFAVQGIELGKRIDAPSKTVSAKWTFQGGQVVKEQSESIAPTGPAATEFHISKKGPWPVGKYKVEVSVDGASAGSKDFEIK